LSPPSSPSDARGHSIVATTAVLAMKFPFAGWILLNVLAPERVLPLIGLGIACGLVNARIFGATLVLFILGIAAGTMEQEHLLFAIYNLLEGPTHLFLTGPASALAVGLALVPGALLLPWLLPVAAVVVGIALALAIMLTDPSLHDPVFTWTPLLVAFWIVLAVALTLRAFPQKWFLIFARILGSWLIAIGLLYGGAELKRVLKPPPPPADTSQESTRGAEMQHSAPVTPPPELNREVPGMPQPERPGFVPGGIERPPQP
jgi:hypothetical protein